MNTPTKLDWEYDHASGEQRAELRGYRIRQVQEQGAANPFEEHECEWPIAVIADGRSDNLTEYPSTAGILAPLDAFGDDALVFNQHHIAKLFHSTSQQLREAFFAQNSADLDNVSEPKHCTDGGILRDVFADLLGDITTASREYFDKVAELWKLSGTHAYSGMTTGYSQGDYAYVLVVATKECIERFGTNPAGIGDDDLKGTVQLYGDWAWGNTYGYVIEEPTEWDEDGDVTEWDEIDSCWGFYGDPGPSGLDEQAFESVPDEPVNAPAPDAIIHELMELA